MSTRQYHEDTTSALKWRMGGEGGWRGWMERVGEEGEARGVRVEWGGMVSEKGNILRTFLVTSDHCNVFPPFIIKLRVMPLVVLPQ